MKQIAVFLILSTVSSVALAASGPETKPAFLNQVEQSVRRQDKAGPRKPASEPQVSKAEEQTGPVGSQISFFEVSPSLGSISIGSKSTFSLGSNVSFRVSQSFPAYFEPGVFLSFFSGQNDRNTSIWHVDAGLRYDLAFAGSALVPFLKAAVGPSLVATSGVTSTNNQVLPDSYVNAFLGGGLKLMVNRSIAARVDAGTTLQNSDFGLYVFGSAVLPL